MFDYMYLSIALNFNFESLIRLILNLISAFIMNRDRFSFLILILDFCVNCDRNLVIFDSVIHLGEYLSTSILRE